MEYNYGSIWRKWDFHVHTPYSILNNNYGFNPFEIGGDKLEASFDNFFRVCHKRYKICSKSICQIKNDIIIFFS